jgi:Mor family transcriptional regulator
MPTRTIAVNALGRRVGDSHHNAKLTDAEVDMLLNLHEEGWGYKKLSAKFELSKTSVRNICNGRTRCQVPTQWRKVFVKE